jgi:hypothetical protein
MAIKIPDMTTAATDEQVYQWDAARSVLSATSELRRVADRIDRAASHLVEGRVSARAAFPNAGEIRDAVNEFRSASDALMYLDSALESALLADQARAYAASAATAQEG